MKKNKKFAFIIISFVLAVLTTITIYLCTAAKDTNIFTIESVKGQNYIISFKQGETTYHNIDIAAKYGLKYENDTNKINFKQNNKIEIKISKLQNLGLTFELEEKKGEVKVTYRGIDKIYKSNDKINIKEFYYNNSITKILIQEFKSFEMINYLTMFIMIIFLTLIYTFLIIYMFKILNKVKNKENIKIQEIIYMCGVYFFLNIFAMLPVMEFMHKFYSILILLQIIGILFYLKKNIKENLSNIFAILAIIFSVNMIILLPALHVPDEYSHYIKAYSIFHKNEIEINKNIPTINISDMMYDNFYKYNCDLHNPNYKTSIKEYFVDLTTIDQGIKKNPINFYNTYTIRNFAYIPASIAINAALEFKLPIIMSTLLGRLINSIIFILLGYSAIRIIPKYKKILFTMLLLPITIQQTAAINQDSITLSIIFILVAIIFDAIYNKEKYISTKKILLILILSAFLGLSKPGYLFITLLTMLIPNKNFKTKKIAYITKILPVLICGGLTLSKYFSQYALTEEVVEKIDGAVSLGYIIKNPMFLIKIFFYTFYQRGTLDLLTGQLNLFGWSTVSYAYFPKDIIYFLVTLILFFDNKEETNLSIKNRIYILVISGITIGLIYASALFGFNTTTIHSHVVNGLQSRYFIPVTFLLAIALSNDVLKINLKNKNLLNIIVLVFTMIVSFYSIISGFYI